MVAINFLQKTLFCFFLFSELAFGFTLTADGLLGYEQSPVRVHLSTVNCPPAIGGYLDDAIDFWNAAPHSNLKVERGSDVSVSNADIRTGNFSETVIVGCLSDMSVVNSTSSALGVGVSVDRTGDQVIDQGMLYINVQNGVTGSFENSSEDTRELTFAHELGHVFGLGHSEEPSAMMYFSTNGSKSRNLHQDDIDGVRHLYPQDEFGGDYLMGCALVKAMDQGPNPPPPGKPLMPLTLLLLPIALLVFLRRRNELPVFFEALR